jgi:hypothetical protein
MGCGNFPASGWEIVFFFGMVTTFRSGPPFAVPSPIAHAGQPRSALVLLPIGGSEFRFFYQPIQHRARQARHLGAPRFSLPDRVLSATAGQYQLD